MAERGQADSLSRENQSSRGAGSMSNPQDSQLLGTETPDNAPDDGGRKTSIRGFAAMDPEKQKQIASEGGRAAHRQGVAHEWSRDEAREAGRKGGQIVSQNRDHMSEIGRKGGQNSGQRRQPGSDE